MTLTPQQVKLLDAPINPALVKIKPTPGSPKFLEGHEAMSAANRIFGYDGWGYMVESIEGFSLPGGVLYRAFVTVSVAGCQPKKDTGVEIASDTRGGDAPSVQAHETAMKGAVTDGIKRALRSYGDQFGASLYDKDADLRAEFAEWQRENDPAPEPRTAGTAPKTPQRAPQAPQRPQSAPAALPPLDDIEAMRVVLEALCEEDREGWDKMRVKEPGGIDTIPADRVPAWLQWMRGRAEKAKAS